MIKDKYLTSKEAADILGFTQNYVRRLILKNKLKAEKLGKTWLISHSALAKIKRQRFKDSEHGSESSD